MRKAVWLSYDLGVKGDYEGLYAYLDDHEAEECGDSLAYFKFSVKKEDKIIEELKIDLSKNVAFSKRDRIYVIWRVGERIKGRFLFGNRKSSPWVGYGKSKTSVDEVD